MRKGMTISSWSPIGLVLSSALAVFAGCTSRVAPFRINPGEQPERYRVTCAGSSRGCRQLAREACEGDYVVVERHANGPEQPEIETTGVSSTGPTKGPVAWRGEMVVDCGRNLAPLRLVRGEGAPAPPSAELGAGHAPTNPEPESPAAPALAPATVSERVCVPGATQACLGSGACAGAQACAPDGASFLPCDCGSNAPAEVVPAPSSLPATP